MTEHNDEWSLEDRDHRAIPQQNITVYCRSDRHGAGIEMDLVEDGEYRCPECDSQVRLESE